MLVDYPFLQTSKPRCPSTFPQNRSSVPSENHLFTSQHASGGLKHSLDRKSRKFSTVSKIDERLFTSTKGVSFDQERLLVYQKRKANNLMETLSIQDKFKSEESKYDTDQGFTSDYEVNRKFSRLPMSQPNKEHDGWGGQNITINEEEDMDPSPLLGTSGMGEVVDMEHDQPYRSAQQLKKSMNQRKRVVKKGGFTNVTYKNISKKRRRYVSDLYTTLLDSPWFHMVILFSASFYLSWLLFAIFYYIICLVHGDFETQNYGNESWSPCILEVDGFAASFLFSLETQHTIGYGSRQTTTECPEAMIIMSLQSVLGCLIQAFMVGLVFSKLSRPQSRSKTVIFSQHAIINVRNRKLCLVFRIGDLRDDNFLLGTQISAKIMRRRITNEGEIFQEMQMVKIDPDTSSEPAIFFVWPLEIVHVIDEDSPLYDMSASDLPKEKFEIVVIMEGTIETSSMTFQARTSYLPSEILWGHRFESMCLYRKDQNKFQVNFSAFHSTYEVETPLCSARELDNYYSNRAKYNRPKGSMISRGIPFSPVPTIDVPFNQPNHTQYNGSHHMLPEYIQRGLDTSSKSASLPRQMPESPNHRAMSPLHDPGYPLHGVNTATHQATQGPVLANHGSVSSHKDRNESESSTDSSVDKVKKKKRSSKNQQD